MRKPKLLAIGLAIGLISALSWAGLTHAQAFQSTTDKNATIDSSLYRSGRTVDIRGTINGDVFCAGQDVTIDATVHGDVLCAGQHVTISGQIYGNIRAAGQTVTLNAQVSHNATLAGQDVKLTPKAKVNQDFTAAGSNITLEGIVGRDLMASGSNVQLANQIGRNVSFNGTNLTLKGQARIGGNLDYTSRQPATIPSTAEIAGDTQHHTPPPEKKRAVLGLSYFSLAVAAMMIVFALALVLAFPQRIHSIASEAVKHLGKTMLTGFLIGGLLPLAAILAAVTFIGLPIALFLLLCWVLLILLSGPLTAYYLGNMILSKAKNPLLIMLLGAPLVALLYLLPVAGALLLFVGFWIGAGSLVRYFIHHTPKPAYKVK